MNTPVPGALVNGLLPRANNAAYLIPSLLLAIGLAAISGCGPDSGQPEGQAAAALENPRVDIETALGTIEVELFAKQAPVTVSNFLQYAQGAFFEGGAFFRTVTPDNQPTNNVKIQVVQAQANPEREREFFAPIVLERTRDTGIRHLDGTLSMARDGPDTAQDSFSICVGAQPELDFGGKRNPDGQGFAAFGRVIRGMDVVRKIHSSPATGQALTPPILIKGTVRRTGERK